VLTGDEVMAYDIGLKAIGALCLFFVILFITSIFFSNALNSILGDFGVAFVVIGFLASLTGMFVVAYNYERL
jgi:hypothetical protein